MRSPGRHPDGEPRPCPGHAYPRPAGQQPAGDDVEKEVVPGRHHDERGHEGVGDRERTQRPVPQDRVERKRAPHRPGHVQAGHRRVLIPRGADQHAFEMPGAVRGHQGVQDPEAGGQQPRRRHREEPEADERQPGDHRERGAGARIVCRVPDEEPDQHERRDQEVRTAVVGVEGIRDGVVADDRGLHGVFAEQAERLLRGDDQQRVAGRRAAGLRHVVPDHLVDHRERGDEADLPDQAPPGSGRDVQGPAPGAA